MCLEFVYGTTPNITSFEITRFSTSDGYSREYEPFSQIQYTGKRTPAQGGGAYAIEPLTWRINGAVTSAQYRACDRLLQRMRSDSQTLEAGIILYDRYQHWVEVGTTQKRATAPGATIATEPGGIYYYAAYKVKIAEYKATKAAVGQGEGDWIITMVLKELDILAP